MLRKRLEFQCSKTRALLRTQRQDQDNGSMAGAAAPAAGSRAGDAADPKPGAGHAKGQRLPETDVLFWPLVTPAKPPTEFTDDPERS